MASKPVTRNPNWTRDELVLAAEFYRRHAPYIPGKTSASLIALSDEILAAAARQGLVGLETFRNPNGVYMKLMEFRKYDPSYLGAGLGHGKWRDVESEVWDLPPDRLASEARQVRLRIAEFIAAGGSPEDARGIGVTQPTTDRQKLAESVAAILARPKLLTTRPKGQEQPATQMMQVIQYARDPRVVAYVLNRAQGVCEACDSPAPFNRADGTPYLEAHHILPLAEGGPDTVENCAALCPNCHRAMHFAENKTEWLSKLSENKARLQLTSQDHLM